MSETENAQEQTAVANKPAAKKPAAKKAVARKVATKTNPAKSAVKSKESGAKPLEQAAQTVQKVAYGHLGIYGFILDGVADGVAKLRNEVPQQWDDLVERGKKVETDLRKNEKEIIAWIKDYSVKDELNQAVENVKGLAENVKQRFSKAA